MMSPAERDFAVEVFRAGFLPPGYVVLAARVVDLLANVDRRTAVGTWDSSPGVVGWYLPGEGSLLRMRGDHTAVMDFGSVLPTRGPWAVIGCTQGVDGASLLFGAESETFASHGWPPAVRLLVLSRAESMASSMDATFHGTHRLAARPHIESLIAMGDGTDVAEAVEQAVRYLTDLSEAEGGPPAWVAATAGRQVLELLG